MNCYGCTEFSLQAGFMCGICLLLAMATVMLYTSYRILDSVKGFRKLPPKFFSLFSSCFTLFHTITTLTTLYKKPFENIVGKRENGANQHFYLFPQCFLPYPKQLLKTFRSYLFCCLQKLSIWTDLNFGKRVYPSPDDKILALSKLKAFADDNSNVAQILF